MRIEITVLTVIILLYHYLNSITYSVSSQIQNKKSIYQVKPSPLHTAACFGCSYVCFYFSFCIQLKIETKAAVEVNPLSSQ